MERINWGIIPWREIYDIQDEIHFDSLEILLHHHEYNFIEVQREKGEFRKYHSYSIKEFSKKLKESF